jgi:Ser/Thr protein kinase RdoA (MazF antagonist)
VAERLRRLVTYVVAAYGLPPIVEISRLTNGAVNRVFALRLESAGTIAPQVVLRIHRAGYRTPDETRSELHFVDSLSRQLDPVVDIPRPLRTRTGDLVVEIPAETGYVSDGGSRLHCDLMTWVEGHELVPGRGFGPAAAYAIGAALAHVHNVSNDLVLPANSALPRWDTTMFGTDSPYHPSTGAEELLSGADLDLFHEIAVRTAEVFADLDQDPRAAGVIHGDYILGNCLVRRQHGRWRVTVVDFDDCGWGYYLYDLCPVLGNMAGYPGSVAGDPHFHDLLRSYLAGYRSVRHLPTDWEIHIPLLMAARNANHCLWSSNPPWRMNLARRCLHLDLKT